MSSAYGLTPGSAPFRDTYWNGDAATAAEAFWMWHESLAAPSVPDLDGDDLAAFFEAQHQAVVDAAADSITIVPASVAIAALRYATTGDRRGWLASQVSAASLATDAADRFPDRDALRAFIGLRAAPHALLLADVAGLARFQHERVRALGEAFFLHGRLFGMHADLAAGRVLLTADESGGRPLAVDEISQSPSPEPVRKAVWRRVVWIRDAFARGMPLAAELDRRLARQLRSSVMLSLELLAQLERRDYDISGIKPGLSRFHQIQARIQARFGRTAWR